jgi:murein DD-endopeptidase MepM/ murein hydrolase activator NlpD
VSTQDLAQVIMKATGAANTFGVSLESMLGHATAIIEVTRESGSVVGNSLKTIYSRITTMDQSISMLENVGVAVRDMNGQLRPVEQILDSLAQRWSSLSAEQQQALGVQLAGRYQLSRFLVLMQQYSQALKAQETAINSNGSAYRENERYLDSYQARLNRLSNAWTETTLAMQKAFLGTGIVAFAELMTAVTKSATSFIDTFGLLPPVLGAVTAGFLLFNNQLRTATMTNGVLMINTLKGLVTGFRTLDGAIAATTLRMRIMDAASKTAIATITGLRTALVSAGTFLAGAVLPTAAFMALGWAIGKVTEKIVEYNEHQKRIKQESQQLANTYATNEEKIQSLADQYERLSNEVQKGLRPKDDEEYLKVQQELYNLIPTVASYVDQKGQAHLRSAEAVRQEIASIRELAKLQSQNFIDNFDKKVDKVKTKIEDLRNQINNIKNPPMNAVAWKAGVPDELTTEDKIDIAIKQREINAQIQQAIGLYKQYAEAYADTLGVKKQLNEEDKKYIETLIEENKATLLTKQGREDLIRQIENDIGKIGDVRKAVGNLFSTDEILSFSDKQIKALISLSSAIKKGNVDWSKWENRLNKVFKDSEKVDNIINQLKGSFNELTDAVNENTIAFGENGLQIKITTDEGEEFVNVYDYLDEKYKETSDKMAVLNKLLEDMASGKQLTAAEAADLISQVHELASAITIENGQVVVNIEAVEEMRKANKKAYSDIIESIKQGLIAQTTATLNKLKLFSSEIRGLKNLEEAHRLVNKAIDKLNKKLYNARSIQEAMVYEKQIKEIKSYGEELDRLADMEKVQTEALDQVGTQLAENKEAISELEKVTKQYETTLKLLNDQLNRANSIRDMYVKGSKEYQKVLDQELKLINDQISALQEKQKALQNIPVSSAGGLGVTADVLNKFLGGKLAGTGALFIKYGQQYGVDPALMAAIAMHETGNGTSNAIRKKNNVGGLMGKNGLMSFSSIEAGIETMARNLWKNYISQGLTTIEAIQKKYAPIGAKNDPTGLNKHWVSGVTKFYQAITGSASSISVQVAGSVSAQVAKYYLDNYTKDIVPQGRFGVSRDGGTRKHQGLDLNQAGAADKGDPIKALMGGKVIQIFTNPNSKTGYGVVIQQDDGKIVRYLHMLEKPKLKSGQRVEAGQVIGKIGDSGSRGSYHLHIGVQDSNGKYIDPLPYLQSLAKGAGSIAEDVNDILVEQSQTTSDLLEAQLKRAEIYLERHQNTLQGFVNKVQNYEHNISILQAKAKELDPDSDQYRLNLQKQIYYQKKIQQEQQKAMKFLEKNLNDPRLTPAGRKELSDALRELQKQYKDTAKIIADAQLDIHKSKIAEFDKDHERLENHINLYEQQKQLVDETSKKYRQITQNQIILENKKIASLRSEIAWAERQIKYDKNLDEAGKAFLREFIAERQKLLNESTQQVAQWQQDIIVSTLHELYMQIDKTFDAMEDRVSRLQHQLKMLGDTEFHPFTIGIMTDEIDALIKEREQTRKDLNRLKQEQKKLKKDSEPYKENLAKIAELEKRLMTIDENIIQADADLKDYYTRVAEQVIEAEKRYYEEKKRIALDALEKEREKIEEVYETEMKAIEDAHEARMRAIDEQLRALERLKETDDYNKQLNKLNKERQEILNQINKLALDDSQEANAKRMELQKQLAEKEDEINELKNNREYELRRQNLEDLREKLNEEYENEREAREKSYEDLTENLDKRREEIEKYYDDIINDTRRWDNITQQILSGQFNNLRKELSNMQTDVAKTMDSASNSVYELVKALEEAQKAMSSLGNNSKINYNETHKQINEALDDPVYWDGAELKDGQIGRIKILKPINLWKRDAQGKLQFVRVLKPGEVFRVYGYDNKYGGQYNVGSGYWITNMKGYVQYETPSKEKLREAQMFDTGGYTGEDEGLAYLHKKEIVLNETDTKNFLDTVKELRSFDSMQILGSLKAATMSFMRIPKIQLPNLSPALAGGGTIQIDNLIHIDKVEKDANINIEKLADQAIDRLITKLKPYGFFK